MVASLLSELNESDKRSHAAHVCVHACARTPAVSEWRVYRSMAVAVGGGSTWLLACAIF